MTETRVIIDLDREATPDQMVEMQDGIEASIDHVVFDTLVPAQGYAGMLASAAGSVVTIGAGRVYNAGKVYAYAGSSGNEFDMLTKLPTATKRLVLIVAYGDVFDTDVGPVNFLVEAQSTPSAPVYKEQTVATTRKRLAIVQAAYGDEAPNPATPGSGLAIPIASILLGPAGILSCLNVAGNKVPNLADHEARIQAMEAFAAKIGPKVSSLESDLANLANLIGNSSDAAARGRILLSIADLNAKVGIPSTAADASSDYLLDGSNSDLAHPLSNCKVQEGIRFADDAAADTVLNLFNPYETAGVVKGGVLFAAYDRYLRTSTGSATGYVSADSYTYNPVSYTQKTIARDRVRYGDQFTVCSNSDFWGQGTYDPITSIFKLPNGETFKASFDPTAGVYAANYGGVSHVGLRVQEFWTDTTNVTYWDSVIQAPQTIAGYHVAETMLIGQDQWLDAVGFRLAKLDAQGAVTLLVCEASDNAIPNASGVLARIDVPFASLAVGENVASLVTPILLQAGKRVSFVIVTTGAHQIATTDGPNFPQGTFQVLAPSGYVQGDLTKHLCLSLYGIKFRQSVVSIQLQNLQLAGGITSIDILAGSIVPASTTRTYEIQLGGKWVPLSGLTTDQLNAGGALNPNIPLRVTYAGTPDMMPALDLAHSNAHVSRPKTSLAHVWPKLPRTPPVSTSQIRVIERFESYVAAQHSWACKLLTGSSYLTQTAPSSYSDAIKIDGSLERTHVFNLGSPVSSYKVLTTATAVTALNVDHGAWIKDYVL